MTWSLLFAVVCGVLSNISNAVPAPDSWDASHLRKRELLGTNFGVPNINMTFDYVIVGGGNAGLAMAARLSEDASKSVAVVEAGELAVQALCWRHTKHFALQEASTSSQTATSASCQLKTLPGQARVLRIIIRWLTGASLQPLKLWVQ